ncbi:MAG: phenylalanine--tRNA ligase subunit alpha [Nanobdellota archaeon]
MVSKKDQSSTSNTSSLTDLDDLIRSLSEIERNILPYLKDSITVDELITETGFKDAEIKRALMWLSNKNILTLDNAKYKIIYLDSLGSFSKEHKLPELLVLENTLSQAKSPQEISTETTLPPQEIMACIGVLKSLQAITVNKSSQGKGLLLQATSAGKALTQEEVYQPQEFISQTTFPKRWDELSNEQQTIAKQLSKRKDLLSIQTKTTTTVHLTSLGISLTKKDIDFSSFEEQLTSDMLKDGSWKEKTFRTYDVSSPVPKIQGGRRHPMREVAGLLRDIYIQMGFQEMKGPWVETAFWCMDSMWIPQDHPARDEQDTFFIGQKGTLPDEELVRRVKEVHETGGDSGSIGHGAPWNAQLSRELILRTHSTATTFRMFGEKGITEGKYFYVANVFRNEAVDTTHLAEFIQAEGFVIGDNLTISDLMGFIKEFYARLGIHKIRFKPTYNPYTEPSIEAHYFNEHTKKWHALINSGIFRPESLAPYGLKDKTVIAWGMGASRMAALLTGKTNLRELVGPTVDFDWIAHHKTPQPNLEEGN